MSAPKRGHYPAAETQVSGGGCAVVHRLDAVTPVSTAAGDVGGDRPGLLEKLQGIGTGALTLRLGLCLFPRTCLSPLPGTLSQDLGLFVRQIDIAGCRTEPGAPACFFEREVPVAAAALPHRGEHVTAAVVVA